MSKIVNKNSETVWEKPVIHKILLTQVTKGGEEKGNDGTGGETGQAQAASS